MADGFDGKTKPVSRARPFHRVGSKAGEIPPAFDAVDADSSRLNGFGYGRGCWSSVEDGPDSSVFALIIKQLIRAVPGWVTPHPAEEIKEIEGPLKRSFQTWTDVPAYQWHRWYDWNFHVEPIPGYKYLRGRGNYTVALDPDDVADGKRHVVIGDTMECEWDTGSISRQTEPPDTNEPQPMRLRGPMFQADWAWPQTGQYFWTTGRWIYDCGHPMPDPSRQDEKDAESDKSQPKPGLHTTELHPCKAMATVRFEAFKFKENTLFVPAVQFMFFASRLGGYHTYSSLTDEDYTFIVDLPPLEASTSLWTIGHTTDFPLNTATLRSPQFLKDLNFDTFAGIIGDFPRIEPIIEEVRGKDEDPLLPPKQVKITIPLKSKAAGKLNSYGVIVSLGWLDPDLTLARKVKKITVKMDHVKVGDDDHENFLTEPGGGRWVLKFAVNGRWIMRIFPSVDEQDKLLLNDVPPFIFHLADDDPVRVSIHGYEQDGVGNFLERNSEAARVLVFRGSAVDYKRDVVGGDREQARAITVRIGEAQAISLGNQNDPLGMADSVEIVKDIKPPKERKLVAPATEEFGGTAVLVEDPSTVDYTLNYTLEVSPQDGLPK